MRRRIPAPHVRTSYQQLVVDALGQRPEGLTINEVRAHCGGSTSSACLALQVLESRGEGAFDGIRWTGR